ncbi:hypothetical protein PHMEG_00014669 [Phytophthora megakarya]|uniref:Uncharacterized protein n=1 Tax=Phytophthora megakarya TaxID=4795 RepID=A0A225W494_9STRA|nr:hypothetical protein PHMEG_00014669 [Phytophthora megakarya]
MWTILTTRSNVFHTHEFPLQLLQEAIDTRVENKVWKVLRKQKIRNELIQSTTTHKVPSDPTQQKYNIFTCVQAAILQNLPQVVLAMYQFNPADYQANSSNLLELNVKFGSGIELERFFSYDTAESVLKDQVEGKKKITCILLPPFQTKRSRSF